MTPEFNAQLEPVIQVPKLDDVESYRKMYAASWMDTYPNAEAGVPLGWVKEHTDGWLTPEALDDSRKKVEIVLADKDRQFLYVAKVGDESVGMVHSSSIGGHQRLEALYVDKRYHGKGLGQELLDMALAKLDPSKSIVLEVLAYNERAQRFYQKNGFAAIPGSEHIYKDVLPCIKMIRQGENQ